MHPVSARFSLVVFAFLGLCGSSALAQAPVVLRATMVHAVDGDTVRVRARGFDTTVRLVGIDTPETKRPGYPVQCGGPAASAETARLLPPGTPVRVVSDPSQDARDRYGRFLGYMYVGAGAGARGSVNFRLVATGFAKAYVYDSSAPFRYTGPFLGAEIRAKRLHRGVWGPPCNGDTTRPQVLPVSGPTGTSGRRCDPNYAGVCIPPPPPDLDCAGITARRFRVVGTDVHHLDSDGDGIACEGARR